MLRADLQGIAERNDGSQASQPEHGSQRRPATQTVKTPAGRAFQFRKKATTLDEESVPDEASEGWFKKATGLGRRVLTDGSNIQGVKRIPWGGKLQFRNKEVSLDNSCSVDNPLQIMYTLYKLHNGTHDYIKEFSEQNVLNSRSLVNAFGCIDQGRYNDAKQTILIDVLGYNPHSLRADLFGGEERFLKAIKYFMKSYCFRDCQNASCNLNGRTDFYISEGNLATTLDDLTLVYNGTQDDPDCEGCHGPTRKRYEWAERGPPPFVAVVFFQDFDEDGMVVPTPQRFPQVPNVQTIMGTKYKPFAVTVYKDAHFTTIFRYNKTCYMYDGKEPQKLYKAFLPEPSAVLNTAWYIRAQ